MYIYVRASLYTTDDRGGTGGGSRGRGDGCSRRLAPLRWDTLRRCCPAPYRLSYVLNSSQELSDAQTVGALHTSPPRNRFTRL